MNCLVETKKTWHKPCFLFKNIIFYIFLYKQTHMLFSKYTTANLNEYNKIMASIDSSQNLDHYEVLTKMCRQFGRNCDYRLASLKRRIWKEWSFSSIDDYYRYKKSTNIQVKALMDRLKYFYDSYQEWLKEYNEEQEEKELKKKQKKPISGFSKLFKKEVK